MDLETGAVIPHGLVPGRFTFYSADNVDINEGTLDAKNTFHATQMAAWHWGPPPEPVLDTLKPSKDRKLTVPEAMDTLMPAQAIEGKAKPVFSKDIDKTWYTDKDVISAKKANATDLAYQIRRQQADVKASWTAFNQTLIADDLEMTTVGYMPIIQAPAHEIDTLNTAVNRCMYISAQLGQEYTVITVDQALYPKLMELKWTIPQYREKLIPRLGGLHTSMAFLNVIGQHMQCSGLAEAWVESGLLGPVAVEKAMAGKSYSKGMRGHKLTVQALWQIVYPLLTDYMDEHDTELK